MSSDIKDKVEAISDNLQDTAIALKTAVVNKLKSKNLNQILRNKLKVVSTIASVFQFVGPIFDIVMMFLPTSKSPELKAIQTGFSEINAALDVQSLRLDQLEDKLDFNAILDVLVNFEASVDDGMDRYNELVMHLNNAAGDLTTRDKSMLEDLINYVRDTGDISKQLKLITKYILKGMDMAFNGERLLSTFRRAEKNDCSKILPFGIKLLILIQNAQKLQFFYELNQGIISVTDDKGYPRDVHNIYVEIVEQYADCNRNVAEYARDVSITAVSLRSHIFFFGF